MPNEEKINRRGDLQLKRSTLILSAMRGKKRFGSRTIKWPKRLKALAATESGGGARVLHVETKVAADAAAAGSNDPEDLLRESSFCSLAAANNTEDSITCKKMKNFQYLKTDLNFPRGVSKS